MFHTCLVTDLVSNTHSKICIILSPILTSSFMYSYKKWVSIAFEVRESLWFITSLFVVRWTVRSNKSMTFDNQVDIITKNKSIKNGFSKTLFYFILAINRNGTQIRMVNKKNLMRRSSSLSRFYKIFPPVLI